MLIEDENTTKRSMPRLIGAKPRGFVCHAVARFRGYTP